MKSPVTYGIEYEMRQRNGTGLMPGTPGEIIRYSPTSSNRPVEIIARTAAPIHTPTFWGSPGVVLTCCVVWAVAVVVALAWLMTR